MLCWLKPQRLWKINVHDNVYVLVSHCMLALVQGNITDFSPPTYMVVEPVETISLLQVCQGYSISG